MATNCEANLFGTRFSSINPCFSLSPPPLYRADHATSRPHSYVVHWVGLYIYIKKTNFSLETHVVLLKILLKRLHDSTGSRIYTAKRFWDDFRWYLFEYCHFFTVHQLFIISFVLTSLMSHSVDEPLHHNKYLVLPSVFLRMGVFCMMQNSGESAGLQNRRKSVPCTETPFTYSCSVPWE